MKPKTGFASLRRYRVTLPGACYFLTICTDRRKPGLTAPKIADAIARELQRLDEDMKTISSDGFQSTPRAQARWPTKSDAIAPFLRAWVIMPDHVHVFFRANEKLSVGQVVGRLKTKTTAALQTKKLRWQTNYYERRLRFDDPVEDMLRYMFLNPYRANLAKTNERYPLFWICSDDAEWFEPKLSDNRPFPEWLD